MQYLDYSPNEFQDATDLLHAISSVLIVILISFFLIAIMIKNPD
jgi:hypothetical protein